VKYNENMVYVTATEYAVSVTSGSDMKGYELNVHRSIPRQPTLDNPVCVQTEYAIKKVYPTRDEAWQAALDAGYIREHRNK
jgi:hypothetical protein